MSDISNRVGKTLQPVKKYTKKENIFSGMIYFLTHQLDIFGGEPALFKGIHHLVNNIHEDLFNLLQKKRNQQIKLGDREQLNGLPLFKSGYQIITE
jgi:hypothetical protein